MTEFERFFGKKIPTQTSSESELDVLKIASTSAEKCSMECAEQLGKCLAFHVCVEDAKPTCTLLMLTGKPTNTTLELGLQHLEDSPVCTAFIVAKGSQLHAALLVDTLARGADGATDEAGVAASVVESDSLDNRVDGGTASDEQSWISMVFNVSLGLALGYLAGVAHKRLTSPVGAYR